MFVLLTWVMEYQNEVFVVRYIFLLYMVSRYVINSPVIHSLLWLLIRLVWSVMQLNKMFVNNSSSTSFQRKYGVATLHSNPVTWNIDVRGIFKFCVVVNCKTCFFVSILLTELSGSIPIIWHIKYIWYAYYTI
jgi:hypothetical protein